jgi:hypothetical protein
MSLNEELLKSAEDALSRGFAILTCLPHDKAPWASYSPNACHSASRVPEVALKAWHDGTEANYGVGCETSGITVLDADHGLANYEEFVAWRTEHNLPPTYTVRTGRRKNKTTGEPEYGIQMYYSGSIPTTAFNIGNVTGELKGKGGYVCGAGSVHPDSGEKYEILEDIDIAPLPDGLRVFEKKKLDFKPTVDGGGLVPAGNRWGTWQSRAGMLRNSGMDAVAMKIALESIAVNNFEDGASYVQANQEKLDKLVEAAFTKFEATVPITVMIGGSNKAISSAIPNLKDAVITGDWIGEMTGELAKGTPLPPAFIRSTIKTILGASIDGMVGFPHHPNLHLRHWNFLIAPAETGKGVSWDRASKWGLADYIKTAGLVPTESGWYSSGEHLVKKLLEVGLEERRTVTHFDEMRLLFEKGASQNSTLLTRMLELFDRAEICAGSCTNSGGSIKNASVSITGGFTHESFTSSLGGKGVAGDGFLSRCVLSYCHAKESVGDWSDIDTAKLNAIQKKMTERFDYIKTLYVPNSPVYTPSETEEAHNKREEVQEWIKHERKGISKTNEKDFCARLEAHFKRDLLLRTVFSDYPNTIVAESVEKSFEWAKHELILRRELWPSDEASAIARMCNKISRAFDKKEHITKEVVMKFCNVKRDGSYDDFNRAWKAMLMSGALYLAGKTQRKIDVFGMKEKDEEED